MEKRSKIWLGEDRAGYVRRLRATAGAVGDGGGVESWGRTPKVALALKAQLWG